MTLIQSTLIVAAAEQLELGGENRDSSSKSTLIARRHERPHGALADAQDTHTTRMPSEQQQRAGAHSRSQRADRIDQYCMIVSDSVLQLDRA